MGAGLGRGGWGGRAEQGGSMSERGSGQYSTVPWLGEGAGAGTGREGTASWVMVTWDPYPP